MAEQRDDEGCGEPGRLSDAAARREAALREILDVISRLRDDEQPVFDSILANASRLCNAPLAFLSLANDARTLVSVPASRGARSEFSGILENFVEPLERTELIAVGPIVHGQIIRMDDVADDDLYRTRDPRRVQMVEVEGVRSVVAVPLLRGEEAIGAIILYRREISPFSNDDVSLLQGFAAQAVIAIENVRKFREVRQRLEREAATRQILQAISRSREDETPVFEVILENAARLCKAPLANLNVVDESGSFLELVSEYGDPLKSIRPGHKWNLSSNLVIARAVRERRLIHVRDLADDELYRQGDPMRVRIVDQEGIRSFLCVPLLSGEEAIGSIGLIRREVRPFADDEIELVETFAAQAVIAIENVRQFRELKARTEEVQVLNADLERRVANQVEELERLARLKRFLPPQVADAVVSSGNEALLGSHRALIAVLFCDIRGFTAFCETAEPEETIEVLQTYHEEMGKLIRDHGAGVDHRSGDGIMVIYNDPLPCDDPAGDALRMALAMRDRMAEFCKKWKRLGHRLGFGVGISFGYATVGLVGSEGRFEYTASGTAVNLAARLCDEAEDGEVLLSPRAYAAVEEDFDAESRGELNLKGIQAPVQVYRVIGPR
jgi:class 3 adenylate cyclase